MAAEVKLPRLGQGMESGTIVRWLKTEGDTVSKGEPLYELDTDKVTQEVEAESDGVLLKIVVSDGEVDVGTTVGVIGTQDEDVSELLAASQGGNGGAPAGAPAERDKPSRRRRPSDSAECDQTPRRGLGGGQALRPTASWATRQGEPPRAPYRARARDGHLGARRYRPRGQGDRGRRRGGREPPAAAPAAPRVATRRSRSSSSRPPARRSPAASPKRGQAPVFQLTVTANATELVATRERMVELILKGQTKPTV